MTAAMPRPGPGSTSAAGLPGRTRRAGSRPRSARAACWPTAAKGFRDRGVSGSFSWAPGDAGRGPSLALTRTVGAPASGGMDALLGRPTLEGLAANEGGSGEGGGPADRRLELRAGYGVSVLEGRFAMTPEFGLALSNGHRDYTLGWRLGLAQSDKTALELSLEATRREPANDNGAPQHGAGFRITARW